MATIITFYTRRRTHWRPWMSWDDEREPYDPGTPAFEVLCLPGDRFEVHGHAGYEMREQLALCARPRWLDPT